MALAGVEAVAPVGVETMCFVLSFVLVVCFIACVCGGAGRR